MGTHGRSGRLEAHVWKRHRAGHQDGAHAHHRGPDGSRRRSFRPRSSSAYDFSGTRQAGSGQLPNALHEVAGKVRSTSYTAYLDVWGEYTDRGAVVGEAGREASRGAPHRGLEEMLEGRLEGAFCGRAPRPRSDPPRHRRPRRRPSSKVAERRRGNADLRRHDRKERNRAFADRLASRGACSTRARSTPRCSLTTIEAP